MLWVRDAWNSVSPEVIRKSFLKCGLTNALDGTEDYIAFAADSDSDPFEGFDTPTAREQKIDAQRSENVAIEHDSINEWSDVKVSHVSSVYSSPDSPGH